MTIDSKCHSASAAGGSGSKAAASSLIIQLPTTSTGQHQRAGPQTESDIRHCHNQAASARLQQQPQAPHDHRHSYTRRQHLTNTTANLIATTTNANQRHRHHAHQHHRISNHRYQQSVTHASIDHHLLTHATAPLAHGEHLDSSTGSSSSQATTTGEETSEPSGTPPPSYHEIPGIVPSYHGRTSGPPPAYDDVMNPNAPPPSYQSLFGQVREARKTSNGLVDLLRQLFLVLIGTLGCTMIIGFLLLIPITMIFIGIFYMNECRAENIPSFLVIGGFVWILKNILNCYNQFKKDSNTINRPPPPRRPPLAVSQAANSNSGASPPTTTSEQHQQQNSATSSQIQTANAQQTNITLPQTPSSSTTPSSTTTTTTTTTTATATTTRGGGGSNGGTTHQLTSQQIRHPPMIGITSYKCESFLNYFLIVWFLAGCIVVYRIYEPDYENPLSASYCNRTVYLYAFWLMTSAFIIMAIILSCLCCLMASSLMSCSHGR